MSWVGTTGGHSGDVVRDGMLAAVEHRFGSALKPPAAIVWLSDNGSGYIAQQARAFAAELGLKPLTIPVCSPQSNGVAESFVKTMKRDYIAFMLRLDAATAVRPWRSRSSITTSITRLSPASIAGCAESTLVLASPARANSSSCTGALNTVTL